MSNTVIPTNYPEAPRDESVVDDFHGTKVSDPYRALEDPDAEVTKNFVQQINTLSKSFISECAVRENITSKLTELWDYPKYSHPGRHGQHYFYSHNTGLQNQSVLYIAKDYKSSGQIFLDPNTLSPDGTTFIRQKSFTKDGTMLAYGLSEKGSDWLTAKFKKIPSGEQLDEELKDLKFSSLEWTNDNLGIFYSTYPSLSKKGDGKSTEKGKNHTLYYHRMGTKQADDVIVAQFPDEPEFMVGCQITDDGNYLIVSADKGCDPHNLMYYIDLKAVDYHIKERPKLIPVIDKFEAKYNFIDNDGKMFIVKTNFDAPMFKLVVFDADNAADKSTWKTIIPEDPINKLDWVSPFGGDRLAVVYLKHVQDILYIYRRTGEKIHEFEELKYGSISGFYGLRHIHDEIFISFTSFLSPGKIYRVDITNDEYKLEMLREIKVKGFDPATISIEQVFYQSKDGTKIPMYILHSKEFVKNGNSPTLLYAYGGFNIAITPYFSISRIIFLHNLGGAFALANIRGGSEYGEKWHEGGMKANKQNVFDDFQAAAQYLIDQKYTQPNKLAIQGGSNGGLLVAACANQRPDLYAAVVNQVGVMDMLRFHKFTIGGAWLTEFGNPDVKEDFEYIYKYSPLHNIKALQAPNQYPSMLLTTADHDDRVVPLHSLKYIAQFYHMLRNKMPHQRNPVLISVEVSAGHGAGKPTKKTIAELSDIYSYLCRVLDMHWID